MTPTVSQRTIAITGATGMIGQALAARLNQRGDRVVPISRRELPGGIRWDPEHSQLDPAALERIDAVVHLAGESIGTRRWSTYRKLRLVDSRVIPTARLSAALADLHSPPAVLISASAIGYYGERGEELLPESAPPGAGFLPELVKSWEAATAVAAAAGIRVVHPRFGVILDHHAGALPRMVTPFRFGLGGRLGSGEQWMSWITLSDTIGAILTAIDDPRLRGPVNLVAPDPVRNRDFTTVLGRVLRRPTSVPAPAALLRLALGEMADALLLTSTRVQPDALEGINFAWEFPTLEPGLRSILTTSR